MKTEKIICGYCKICNKEIMQEDNFKTISGYGLICGGCNLEETVSDN